MPQSGYLSDGTTNFTSNVSVSDRLSIGSNVSLSGTLYTTGVATFAAAINSGSALSAGAITGTTGAFTQVSLSSVDCLSIATAANASSMTKGELRIVFAASGISLMFSSGASSYVIGQSSQSAAQA